MLHRLPDELKNVNITFDRESGQIVFPPDITETQKAAYYRWTETVQHAQDQLIEIDKPT